MVVVGFFLLAAIGSLIGPPDNSSTSKTTSASVAEIPVGSGAARDLPGETKGHASSHHKKTAPKKESEP